MKQHDLHFDDALLNVRRILVAIVVSAAAVISFLGTLYVFEEIARAFVGHPNFIKAGKAILRSEEAALGIFLSAILLVPYVVTRLTYSMTKRYRLGALLLLDRTRNMLNTGWLEPKSGGRPGLGRQICRPVLTLLTIFATYLTIGFSVVALLDPDPSTGGATDFFALLFLRFLSLGYAVLMGIAVFLFLGAKRRRPEWPCCEQCDYNLTGNVSGVCPECGTPIQNEETQKRKNTEMEKVAYEEVFLRAGEQARADDPRVVAEFSGDQGDSGSGAQSGIAHGSQTISGLPDDARQRLYDTAAQANDEPV